MKINYRPLSLTKLLNENEKVTDAIIILFKLQTLDLRFIHVLKFGLSLMGISNIPCSQSDKKASNEVNTLILIAQDPENVERVFVRI